MILTCLLSFRLRKNFCHAPASNGQVPWFRRNISINKTTNCPLNYHSSSGSAYISSYSNYMRLHHNPWWKGPALWYLHRLSESNSLLMFSVFRTSLFSIVLNLSLCFWWSVPPSRHFWITEHSCRLCGSLYVQFLTAVTLFRILYAKSWNYVWAKAQSPLLMMPVWQLRISKSMWWTCSVLSLNVSVL